MIFHEQMRLPNRQKAASSHISHQARWLHRDDRHTLTIHFGVFCVQPSTRSVRMIPVSGSTVRSRTSMVWTCVQCGLGYLCHIPITTCDQGWLGQNFQRELH